MEVGLPTLLRPAGRTDRRKPSADRRQRLPDRTRPRALRDHRRNAENIVKAADALGRYYQQTSPASGCPPAVVLFQAPISPQSELALERAQTGEGRFWRGYRRTSLLNLVTEKTVQTWYGYFITNKISRASEMRNSFRISRRIGSAASLDGLGSYKFKAKRAGILSGSTLPVVLFLNPQFTSRESLHRALAPIGRNLQ
mgnify:CR=1 FL=1